jgi:uncharacterized protein
MEQKSSKKRVLLTGGTGFVGKYLTPTLIKAGYQVRVVTRQAFKYSNKSGHPIEYVNLPTTAEDFDHALHDVSHIINLAGEPIVGQRWSPEVKESIRSSRIDFTREIAAAVKRAPAGSIQSFLSGSAVGIYPDHLERQYTEPDLEKSDDFLAEVCRHWEDAAQQAQQSTSVSILRIGVVLGHGGGMLDKIYPLFAKGMGAILGSGKQWVSWIHIEDLIASIMHILESSHPQAREPQVYNLVSPKPETHGQLMRNLAEILAKPLLVKAPKFGLNLALGEAAEAILASQKVLPQQLLASKYVFQFPTLDEALVDLCSPGGCLGARLKRFWLFIPKKVDEVFSFFCDETNLEKLTPPTLKFKVVSKSTPEISAGTLIDYRLKIHGFPAKWRTEILDWQPPHSFVDTQLKGPYRFWHHTHTFHEVSEGTLIEDEVAYKLPFGGVGDAFGAAFVNNDVNRIFAYRTKMIREILG